jgi:hypothetical protein
LLRLSVSLFALPSEIDYPMMFRLTPLSLCLLAGLFIRGSDTLLLAQTNSVSYAIESNPAYVRFAEVDFPDAPIPQTPAAPQSPASKPDPATPDVGTSSSTTKPATDTAQAADGTPQKSKEDIAEEQLKQQKKQRVFGFLPSFNTTYVGDEAVSLTRKQKIHLAFTSATDPVQFGIAGFVAGIGQARGSPDEYGGGIEGYAKRFGADYADSFNGAMIGNGFLPALLHQDPRYFRLGYGSKTKRIFYALSGAVRCKHDNTGKWEPNYSNMLGNLAAGGISNLYAPESDRGVGNTFEGAALVTVEGGIGSIVQEFWPDLSRHFLHKDPTHGRDAINNATKK